MFNSIHALIVEDSLVAQKVMILQMTKHGCIVDTALNGATALEKTLHTAYNLILMDIGLGEGADGFEVTAQIKQQSNLNKATPIIAVTAHGEPEYRDKALQYGMVGYFTKPLTPIATQKIMDAFKEL